MSIECHSKVSRGSRCIVRFPMRTTLSALSLLAFAQIAMGQGAPSDATAQSLPRLAHGAFA
jgi:hypothetical protein